MKNKYVYWESGELGQEGVKSYVGELHAEFRDVIIINTADPIALILGHWWTLMDDFYQVPRSECTLFDRKEDAAKIALIRMSEHNRILKEKPVSSKIPCMSK